MAPLLDATEGKAERLVVVEHAAAGAEKMQVPATCCTELLPTPCVTVNAPIKNRTCTVIEISGSMHFQS